MLIIWFEHRSKFIGEAILECHDADAKWSTIPQCLTSIAPPEAQPIGFSHLEEYHDESMETTKSSSSLVIAYNDLLEDQ